MNLPKSVQINDVMLRDGLQLEDKILTVDEKYILVQGLLDANVKQLEFGSFVHPKLVPQMANSGDLFTKIKEHEEKTFVSLVLNLKGVETANEQVLKNLILYSLLVYTHNLQNVGQTTEESLESLVVISEFSKKKGMKLNVSIATTFGCPFEGGVPVERIHSII